jgi:Flp pilus assembly protein TadB
MAEIPAKEPMAMCPMASMCRGLAEKPPSRLLLMIPGLALILVGLLILLEPKVLVWLMAAVAIMLGVLVLVIANFLHRISGRFQDAHS